MQGSPQALAKTRFFNGSGLPEARFGIYSKSPFHKPIKQRHTQWVLSDLNLYMDYQADEQEYSQHVKNPWLAVLTVGRIAISSAGGGSDARAPCAGGVIVVKQMLYS